MTNKQAIEILSIIRHTPSVDVFNILPNTSDCCIELDYRNSLDLAIKALEFIEENVPKTFEDYLNGENLYER